MGTPGFKILLVYDYLESRTLIEQILLATDLENPELDCIASQVVLQNASSRQRYDVCLLDSTAGRSSSLTRTIRVAFNCPVVMLTGDSGVEVLNALHGGASDCLIRNSLTPSRLEEAICSVVEQARLAASSDKYERWYLGLVENSTDAIYTMDLEGNYTSINKAGELLTGYTSEEILTMNFKQLIAPDYVYLVWGSLVRMLEDRRPTIHQVDIVTKMGERVFLRMANHLLYQYGRPIGIQGVANEPGVSFTSPSDKINLPFSFSEPTR
jgi:PAS domain S-box-containing protein